MSVNSGVRKGERTDVAQLLADVVRDLNRISRFLAAYVQENSPEADDLKATREALGSLARRLDEEAIGWRTAQAEKGETARLRQAVLENLHRRGPALVHELAAATLSLPDEIRPILQEIQQEGLVEIQNVRGWDTVSLTARGLSALRNP